MSSSGDYVAVLRNFYDRVGESYNGGHMGEWHRDAAEALVSAAGSCVQEGSWILDLATGTGNVALSAAGKVGGIGRVVGVDISEKFLEIARRNAEKAGMQNTIEFLNQDVTHLSLPETRRFDVIFCASAFPLFPHPGALLRDIASHLLSSDGLFVADMHGTLPSGLFMTIAAEKGIKLRLDPVWFSDPKLALQQVIEGTGLKVVQTSARPDSGRPVEWDIRSQEKIEALWNMMVANAPWLGVDAISSDTLAELKDIWQQRILASENTDGVITERVYQHIIVAKRIG